MHRRSLSSSICFDCANATADNCAWLKNFDKRDLIEYESRMVKGMSGRGGYVKYKEYVSVQKCKNFKEGPLKANHKLASNL